ncbi:MAG TPA: carboxypeptidase regulatory-like domain-containing protein [Candidatus Acidoferrum sp.]|nr:carboxypeptidase regulatory-like domain-containing protein [Candidatus Acidoferrum sp.]
MRNVLMVLRVLVFATPVLHAQGTGTIHGSVTDASTAAVVNAKVTAILEERGTTRAATTDSQGTYVFPLLPIGSYTIRIEVNGFKVFVRSGIELSANENDRVDAQLEIGDTSQSVTVAAEAPMVDSRSSVVGTLIDTRRVTDLPTNGRNVISLAGILPGVASISAPQTFTGDRSGPTLSVSGSRQNENLFLFDGAQFNAVFRNTGLNYPPPDALQEVKVLTNSFSAEYGRNAGAVFNVVTKAGTNQFHGTLWEFLRNQDLNARNFFAPSVKPQLIQNQFGAAGGGPFKREKLFFFASYEGLRIRPAALGTSAFPLTAAERSGDFSGATAVTDPQNNAPFPANQIPVSRFDPVAKNLISPNYMPLPNAPGGQLITTFPQPQNNDQGLVRGDYNAGKHTFDGRYNYNLATQVSTAGQVPAYLPLDNLARVQSITIGDTTVVRPQLLNQARISFNRVLATIANLNRINMPDLGGNFPVLGPKIPPAIAISGRVTLGNGSTVDAITVNESLQADDSVHWTHGQHAINAGFGLLHLRYLNRSYFETMGDFTFSGIISGNAAADFLLGRAQSLTVASPVLEQAGLQTNTYYFIQDDWKIMSRLTLNLGLRYELPLPWVHPHDYWGTLRLGQQSQQIPTAPLGMVFPRDPGVPRGLVQTDTNNFAPRFGFAWDPFGHGRTSVRGAYGIFYETVNSDIIQNTSQPYRYTFTINQPFSLADPLRGQPPIPLVLNLKTPAFVGLQQLFYPDPALRSPYVQNFNLNLQHEMVKDLVIQVGYFGKLGRKLLMGIVTNPGLFRPGASLANLDSRRLLQPGFGNNSEISSEAVSSYNSLQVEVKKRYSRGFSVEGAYTWSRSLDDASAFSLGAAVPNVFNLHSQWGVSDFFAKHIASISWIWDLPALRRSNATLRTAAGGWQVNGLVSLRSGTPINVVTGADNALSGTNNQRPDVVGNPHLPEGRTKAAEILAWFDRTAFAAPAPGNYGDAGRNALTGPSAATANLAVLKNFPIPGKEGLLLQFRSEFFNVLNAVNLSNPNGTLGTNMGRITSAAEARVIQFAVKVRF